jgi:hypothetical protein
MAEPFAQPRPCEICAEPFTPSLSNLKAGKGKTCSVKCRMAKARMLATPAVRHGLTRNGPNGERRWVRSALNAKAAVNRAIRKGVLVRPSTCSRCGSMDRIEGHHEDYAKPLDVVWLCRLCHRRHHAEMFREGRLVAGIAS